MTELASPSQLRASFLRWSLVTVPAPPPAGVTVTVKVCDPPPPPPLSEGARSPWQLERNKTLATVKVTRHSLEVRCMEDLLSCDVGIG